MPLLGGVIDIIQLIVYHTQVVISRIWPIVETVYRAMAYLSPRECDAY